MLRCVVETETVGVAVLDYVVPEARKIVAEIVLAVG